MIEEATFGMGEIWFGQKKNICIPTYTIGFILVFWMLR